MAPRSDISHSRGRLVMAPRRDVCHSRGSLQHSQTRVLRSSWYTFWLFTFGFATFTWKFHLLIAKLIISHVVSFRSPRQLLFFNPTISILSCKLCFYFYGKQKNKIKKKTRQDSARNARPRPVLEGRIISTFFSFFTDKARKFTKNHFMLLLRPNSLKIHRKLSLALEGK